MALPTVSDLRQAVGKDLPDDNAELQECLDAALQLVNDHCNRPDGWEAVSTATARIYPGTGKYYTWFDECVEITEVAVKDSPSDTDYVVWDAGDWVPFQGDPEWPDFNRTPYHGIMVTATGTVQTFTSGLFTGLRGFKPDSEHVRNVPTVRITAKWGNQVVIPASVKRAVIIQAARYYKRGQSAYQDAVGSDAAGGILLYRSKLDADIVEILDNGRHVRPAIGRV